MGSVRWKVVVRFVEEVGFMVIFVMDVVTVVVIVLEEWFVESVYEFVDEGSVWSDVEVNERFDHFGTVLIFGDLH